MQKHAYQHMMVDHYVARLRRKREEREKRLAAVKTRKQALAYQDEVRAAVDRAFSPRPPRTPLNPRVTGTIETPEYRIEKVLFESRPGFLVSANLYVPAGVHEPRPGVIGTCGHANEGKAHELYQGFCQRLVLNGFVVLILDPISQGERDMYSRLPGRKGITGCCHDHNMQGKQLELVGEYFGMWRAWDGMRALDYLLTRPEVDPTRVGVTGNSGGGTMTSWLWASEPRFTMAAPSCFITTFLCNLENELPADVEQYPPGVLGAGLEMADILYAAAPKPILLLGQLHDYFDVRGLRWAHGELRRLYRILGAPDRDIRLFVGPRPHGFYVENQEAMVAFFMQHARMGRMKSIPQTANRSVQELATTPDADVVKAGSRPSYELIAEAADRLAAGRKALSRSALRQALRRLLRITGRKSVPHYRILPVRKIADVSISRYAVETEPNIVGILKTPVAPCAPQLVFDDRKEAILYIPHLASEIELETEPLVKTLLQKERVYLIDPRGLGESMPEPPDEFFAPYGMDYMMHGHGILFGESYLGGRVRDVLAAMDLMASEGAKRIHLAGRGQGAVIALFAALLHPKAGTVTLKNGPLSYDEWAHSILVQWPAATAPRGVLKHFDIPDCIRALGDRVCLIEPWNPEMRPYNAATLQTAMACFRLPMSLVKTEM